MFHGAQNRCEAKVKGSWFHSVHLCRVHTLIWTRRITQRLKGLWDKLTVYFSPYFRTGDSRSRVLKMMLTIIKPRSTSSEKVIAPVFGDLNISIPKIKIIPEI